MVLVIASDPTLIQVHIRFNFMEDRFPNRHFSTPVRQRPRLFPLNDFRYPPERDTFRHFGAL
jgi:hypothetical protein